MRVLICHYNPGQGGGAESAVKDQTKALELLGHTVAVEHIHPDRAYARFRPDIIHFHTIHIGMGLKVLQWAQAREIPHCLSLHDYWPFCSDRMLLSHYDQPCAAVNGMCNEQCESTPSDPEVTALVNGSPVVTFNEYSAAIYRRHGIRVDAIIPHGIDVEMFCPDYDKRDGVNIVTSSAWAAYPTKGMHVLKAALQITGRKAKLISGVSREQVRNELQKASVFVFPSCYEETWGLCLTEAMACGCACIASNVCGPRAQIKHGETGLLVPPRDPQALSDAIEWLLYDGKMRDDVGLNACVWARENCNLERMGRDYEAFYSEVIHG